MLKSLVAAMDNNRKHSVKSEFGGTAIEYALILAFIAMAIIVAVSDTGQGVSSPFSSAGNSMDSAVR